jgi:DNA-binding MarR family transcriptional regulator
VPLLDKDLFATIDETIHAKVRLGIMTLLVTQGELDFSQLRQKLDLSDGNLSAHIKVLEEAEYIVVNKTFLGRRPKTVLLGTSKGHTAYMAYLNKLESILRIVKDNTE